MSLNSKQARFAYKIAKLIVWAKDYRGIDLIGSEWYRTPEQAQLYEEQGKGIANSNHTRKLAFDMYVYKDGAVSWEPEDYRVIGEKWETMDEDARWGGRFGDYVHFSFEHNGVK